MGMAMANIGGQRWYVAAVHPTMELLAVEELGKQRFSVWVPMHRLRSFVRHEYRSRDYPLFPGYVFVQFDEMIDRWPAINSTRGVWKLLPSWRPRPMPMPSGVIEAWREQIGPSGIIEIGDPEIWRPKPGESVRLVCGLRFGETGVCISSKGECVDIMLDFLGGKRKTSLRLDQVEPDAKAL